MIVCRDTNIVIYLIEADPSWIARIPSKEERHMPANTVVIQGLVKPDGTLELEGKVPLPPGKVSVTLQPMPEVPYSQETDPFFEMLRSIRALRERDGVKPDADAALAAAQKVRDEFDEQVEELGQLQDDCRRQRLEAEAAEKGAG